MRVELLTKDEKTMRKVCNYHKFRWAVAINGHDYDFYGARGDVSVHEIAELVATFIQATGYNYSLNITAEAVKTLREQTGWGMMDCKSALVEADGDMNKAQEVLRKKNGGQAAGNSY